MIADGSWGKRSYGHNYSSKTGCGCIIGYESKGILFMGTKIKNVNYRGTSTGMESLILK